MCLHRLTFAENKVGRYKVEVDALNAVVLRAGLLEIVTLKIKKDRLTKTKVAILKVLQGRCQLVSKSNRRSTHLVRTPVLMAYAHKLFTKLSDDANPVLSLFKK